VGENGESIINDIAKEKGSKDIVNKLRQWLLDFWKSLKSTFSNFSDEELQKLTLEDFNMMTVRDFVELNDENNVSKVVDKNGEPLVVYHHTDDPNLDKFSTDFENYFAKDGGTKEAIFFDEEKTGTLNRKYDLPVFLNIRELNEYNETKQQLHDRGTTYREIVNNSAKKNNKTGGVHMKDFDDNKKEHQNIWIIHNSNQVKSATDNNGEFSTENDSIRFHVSKNQVLRNIREYIENYIKNKFGTGNSYERIRAKVKELEEQFGIVGVAVSAGKKLNFDQLHFKGDPLQNERRIARL
jgi:peptide methionine sulfoxide reductase MsrA